MQLNLLSVHNRYVTMREAQVLLGCANGLTTKAIALQLFISEHTVKRHRDNLRERFGLKGYHSLQLLALEMKPALEKWVG